MIKTYKDTLKLGEKLTCPVCGTEFKVTEDTCCVAGGGYTCSWKCFLNKVVYNKVNPSQNKNSEEIVTDIPERVIEEPVKKTSKKKLSQKNNSKETVTEKEKQVKHKTTTSTYQKSKIQNKNSESIILEKPAKKRGRPRKENK